MESNLLGGLLLLVIGIFIAIIILFTKIKQFLLVHHLNYRLIKGTVINSINVSNPEEAFIINDRGKILWLIIVIVLIGFGVKLVFLNN